MPFFILPLSSALAFFFTAFYPPLYCLFLHFIPLPFFPSYVSPSLPVLCFAVRADINECERVPMPCAYQCVNSPGSYTCTCPPGRYLLGDGKSCAGLERLPRFESLSYGFHSSQTSPEQSSSQRRYHSMTSQSYHSYPVTGGNHRRNAYSSRSRRATKPCPLGFISDNCIGNSKDFFLSALKLLLLCSRTLAFCLHRKT